MGTGDWCHPTSLKITRHLLKKKDWDKIKCPGRCKDKTTRYSSDTFNDSCIAAIQLPSFLFICNEDYVLGPRCWLEGLVACKTSPKSNYGISGPFSVSYWAESCWRKQGATAKRSASHTCPLDTVLTIQKEGGVIMSAGIEEILQLLMPLHCSKWWTAGAC